MAWVPHGPSDSGLVQSHRHGQTSTSPAVAAYRGQLWCLWTDPGGSTWYAATDDRDGQFGGRVPFPKAGRPVVANLDGHLHVLITTNAGDMFHYVHEGLDWTLMEHGPKGIPWSSPCMQAFRNQLFVAFVGDGGLQYAVWTSSTDRPPVGDPGKTTGTWSKPLVVCDDQRTISGTPEMVVLGGSLHILSTADTRPPRTICYRYDDTNGNWSSCDDVTEGRGVRGATATSFGDKAFVGFTRSTPGGQANSVYVACFADGKWLPQEAVDGRSAADPPQIAVLNGRIHCIFNDNTAAKDLRWYSRPLLDYNLSSWMSAIPDEFPLSRLTIPGTHDSCARSNIPFVRTQYLSISQQLALGIRFLDLRLRRHDNGSLYCYHGGVPLGLPGRLSFDAVMSSVWIFLRGPDGTLPPTETVLISIDNDDSSPAQRANPGIFSRAVAAAIKATAPYPDLTPRWCTATYTASLGQVRGRAVLLRRYAGDPDAPPGRGEKGLDLSGWVNDSPSFTLALQDNLRVHVQDKWRFTERIALSDLVARKGEYVAALMARAAAAADRRPSPLSLEGNWEVVGADGTSSYSDKEDEVEEKPWWDWYINFCSAVGDPRGAGEVAEAKWIAVGARSDWVGKWVDGMNTVTKKFIEEQDQEGWVCTDVERGEKKVRGKGIRLGIVNLDYPELPVGNDLVPRLIEMNF